MNHIHPRPRGLRQSQALAMGARQHHHIRNSSMDLMTAISLFGGKVTFTENPKILLTVKSDLSFEIESSVLTSLTRDTFRHAVALGHYFLHAFPGLALSTDALARMVVPYDGDPSDHDFTSSRREANWFAFGMLMPEDEFRAVVAESGIDGAAARFGVDTKTAALRESMHPADET